MTRDDIVAEAARRLGDASTQFLAEVQLAFDYVLGDLAAHECLGDLRRVASAATLVAGQRDYDARTLTGLAAPDWPERIVSLRVWAWGIESLLEGPVVDRVFEARRAADGEDATGRPCLWRYFPNRRTVQLHPPAGDDEDGETIECVYLAPPTVLTGAQHIEEIRREDLETIVYGLQARLAPFLDETQADPATAWSLYVAGRDRMYARLHSTGVGNIIPAE